MRPLVFCVSLALAGGLLIACGVDDPPARQSGIAPVKVADCCVSWAHFARSLDGMRRDSELVVRGTVEQRRAGPRLGTRAPTLPSTLVTLRVERVITGKAPRSITVFRNGTPTGGFPDSAPYAPGQRYVLGLRSTRSLISGRRVWVPVGPDAALLVSGTQVGTFVDGPLRRELSRLAATSALQRVEAKLGGRG